jgi:toxin ParE1/3/4
MSRRIQTTAHAEEDIWGIAQWIARDREALPAAIKWLEDLDSKFETLADIPGVGTDRSDLMPGVRSYPFGNYLIFFKPIRDGVQIVRVLHGARDYRRFFE